MSKARNLKTMKLWHPDLNTWITPSPEAVTALRSARAALKRHHHAAFLREMEQIRRETNDWTDDAAVARVVARQDGEMASLVDTAIARLERQFTASTTEERS